MRIVNISPLGLMRDTRSYKMVNSFSRFGWQVTAVEGLDSHVPQGELPFPVITLGRRRAKSPNNAKTNHLKSSNRVKRHISAPIWERLSFVWFVAVVFIVYPVIGVIRIPRADVYYLHEYRFFPMVWVLSKISRARIVYDAHDFYQSVHKDQDLTPFWRNYFMPFLGWLEAICVRRVNAATTVNGGIAEAYNARFGINMDVLRNSQDPRLERSPDKDVRSVLDLDHDTFLWISIGNRKPGQAVDNGLDALAGTAANVHLAFVGKGYEIDQAAVKARDLEGRVHFFPDIDANQIVPFVRSADAGMLLNTAHSDNDVYLLPNGLFQLLSAKLPTIYPDLKWVRDIGDRYGIGACVDPADTTALQKAMTEIMDLSPQETDELKERTSKAAIETSWEREEHKLRSVVEGIVCTRP